MDLKALSVGRYNGGIAAKRKHGSSTITTFLVWRCCDTEFSDRSVQVEVGGKTPGARATTAKKIAEPLIRELLKSKGIPCE